MKKVLSILALALFTIGLTASCEADTSLEETDALYQMASDDDDNPSTRERSSDDDDNPSTRTRSSDDDDNPSTRTRSSEDDDNPSTRGGN